MKNHHPWKILQWWENPRPKRRSFQSVRCEEGRWDWMGRSKAWAHWNTKSEVKWWLEICCFLFMRLLLEQTGLHCVFGDQFFLKFHAQIAKAETFLREALRIYVFLIPMIQSSLAFDGGLMFGILYNQWPNQWRILSCKVTNSMPLFGRSFETCSKKQDICGCKTLQRSCWTMNHGYQGL